MFPTAAACHADSFAWIKFKLKKENSTICHSSFHIHSLYFTRISICFLPQAIITLTCSPGSQVAKAREFRRWNNISQCGLFRWMSKMKTEKNEGACLLLISSEREMHQCRYRLRLPKAKRKCIFEDNKWRSKYHQRISTNFSSPTHSLSQKSFQSSLILFHRSPLLSCHQSYLSLQNWIPMQDSPRSNQKWPKLKSSQ